MKTLLTVLAIILLAATVQAATVHLDFDYDSQAIPDYKATHMTVEMDGAYLCDGPLDELMTGSCGNFEIYGVHGFAVKITGADGVETELSDVVQVTIPEPPVVLPPRKKPKIKKIRYEHDDGTITILFEDMT